MPQIVSKLNLNKTPSVVENNSLVFAKNIRLDIDGTIHKDYGIHTIGSDYINNKKYNHFLDKIKYDTLYEKDNNSSSAQRELYSYLYDNLVKPFIEPYTTLENVEAESAKVNIVGHIENNNEFYVFLYLERTVERIENNKETPEETSEETPEETLVKVTIGNSLIVCYNEKTDKALPCNCNWKYSGGTISGNVVTNLIGDKILTIAESNTVTLVPLKHINLTKSSYSDNESVYTQTPNIPITNLRYNGKFGFTIPCGVYQFFVRYKIREGLYTNWFPASRELFAGNKKEVNTNLGTVSYSNRKTDADKSFIFKVQHLTTINTELYESFQIGFILSHDSGVYARAWKHFTFDKSVINFDYDANDATEIEVTDLLKISYQLYNVGNVTSFKNKLYISNYIETNFNPDLQDKANEVKIDLSKKKSTAGYGDYPIESVSIGNNNYISALVIDGTSTNIGGTSGVIDKILSNRSNADRPSINDILQNINNTSFEFKNGTSTSYGIDIYINAQHINTVQNNLNKNKDLRNVTFDSTNTIVAIYINDKKQSYKTINDLISYILGQTKYIDENGNIVNAQGTKINKLSIQLQRYYSGERRTYVSNEEDTFLPSIDKPSTNTPSVDTELDLIGGVRPGGSIKWVPFTNATYNQDITLTFSGKKSLINTTNTDNLIDYTTLIPYQKYKFYIHYVTKTGEITNGYYCGGEEAGEIEVGYQATCDSMVYPIFHNVVIPDGYIACFFSIFHSAINSSTIFGLEDVSNSDGQVIAIDGYCIDMNSRLIPFGKNLNIVQNQIKTGDITVPGGDIKPILPGDIVKPPLEPILPNGETNTETTELSDTEITSEEIRVTAKGTYYDSSDSSTTRYFGACGLVNINKDSNIDKLAYAYAINDYESQQEDDVQLIKCTPFIIKELLTSVDYNNDDTTKTLENAYDDYEDLNLGGYICQVHMLSKERTTTLYTDGTSLYHKSGAYDLQDTGDYGILKFTEYSNYQGETAPWIGNVVNLVETKRYSIYSNYNLNYLMLEPDISTTFKTYYAAEEGSTNIKDNTLSAMLRLLTSLTLSEIYKLPDMYYKYTRKTYIPYNKKGISNTIFNNTIRCSTLVGDESSFDIFTFDANDYYNVPTNRGIIVYLIAVGDNILVHSQDSIFKFSGANTIQSSDGEIQPTENNPFETGISEIFGSDFGFAGLQNKKDCITTEDGYIFFDRDSKIIYMYSGQGQLVKISDSIEKLFRYKEIKDICFANDYYHNRFFINIKFIDNTFVTLSFSLINNIKSFISLHDFTFVDSFNTKTKCYFLDNLFYEYTNDNTKYPEICTIDESQTFTYDILGVYDEKDLYVKDVNNIEITVTHPNESETTSKTITLTSFNSIIDVICNINYETVKTLDYVNWCSSYIETEIKPYDKDDFDTIKLADAILYQKPCNNLRLYTDTCCSEVISCENNSNSVSITNLNSYKYPRYNNGKWTASYFRDIENTTDRFNYLKKYNDGRENALLRSDNNSLIEGKYFVIRFVFNENFKLETVTFVFKNKI